MFSAKVYPHPLVTLSLQNMKITIVQPELAWCDPVANRAHLEEMIGRALSTETSSEDDSEVGSSLGAQSGEAPLSKISEPGLVVIPEMFSTGFVTDPVGVAEENCESLEWMKSIAASTGCAIAGSIATKLSNPTLEGKEQSIQAAAGVSDCRVGENTQIPGKPSYRNRFYFVRPDGEVTYYDKHHLFTYSGEHLRYTPGQDRTIVEWGGFRIMLQVCYDLRFPGFSRNSLEADGRAAYDLCIYVASWPENRSGAWKTLLRARAIENQCYVVGVNRVGSDPSCRYSGDSAIIDPYGDTLAACTPSEECSASATIGLKSLLDFRARFPVLKDADKPGMLI